jgi:hypothetical protein
VVVDGHPVRLDGARVDRESVLGHQAFLPDMPGCRRKAAVRMSPGALPTQEQFSFAVRRAA